MAMVMTAIYYTDSDMAGLDSHFQMDVWKCFSQQVHENDPALAVRLFIACGQTVKMNTEVIRMLLDSLLVADCLVD